MKRIMKKGFQRSIFKKMFALSVLMSAAILMTGCSGIAAGTLESTETERGSEALQESAASAGGAVTGGNHISGQWSDQLVVDAEVVLPKENAYSVYALTKNTFPREDLANFFGVSEAVVTAHPAWTGAYFAEMKGGGYFRTDPLGNFTYAEDEEKDEYIIYLVESAYYDAESRFFREEEMCCLFAAVSNQHRGLRSSCAAIC